MAAFSTLVGAECSLYPHRCAYPACGKFLNELPTERIVCCTLASYCSGSCQRSDWHHHKTVCLSPAGDKTEVKKQVTAGGDVCASCSKPSSTLKLCSRCRNVSYCSKSCQQAHWPIHKPRCRSQLTHDKPGAGVSTQDDETGNQDVLRRECGSCGKASESLKQCTRCRRVSYCDRSCQRADWPRHRSTCEAFEKRNDNKPKHLNMDAVD